MKLDERFIDKNGMVKPQKNWDHSGNGILYSSIAKILGFDFDYNIENCKIRDGLYMRTPDNAFGNQSWDDYLGIAAFAIHTNDTKIPRQVLMYGLTHFFIFNTDQKLEAKDFLGRFIQLWSLMFVAAFPKIRKVFYPILYFVQLTFDLNPHDSSAYQLEWLYLKSCDQVGIKFNRYYNAKANLGTVFKAYYDSEHPFNKLEH